VPLAGDHPLELERIAPEILVTEGVVMESAFSFLQHRRGIAADVAREGVRLTADRTVFRDARSAVMATPKRDGKHQHGSCDCNLGAARVRILPGRGCDHANRLQTIYRILGRQSITQTATGI
jgi:hypothetical protein